MPVSGTEEIRIVVLEALEEGRPQNIRVHEFMELIASKTGKNLDTMSMSKRESLKEKLTEAIAYLTMEQYITVPKRQAYTKTAKGQRYLEELRSAVESDDVQGVESVEAVEFTHDDTQPVDAATLPDDDMQSVEAVELQQDDTQPVVADDVCDDDTQQPEAQTDNADFDALPDDTQPLDAETFPDDDVQGVDTVELPQEDTQTVDAEADNTDFDTLPDDIQPVDAEDVSDDDMQQPEAQTDNTDFDALPDDIQPVEADDVSDDDAQTVEAEADNTDFDALPDDTQSVDAEALPDDEAQPVEDPTDNTDFDTLPDDIQPVDADDVSDDDAQQPEAQIDNTDFDALPEDTQPLDAETFPDDVQNVEAVELPQDDAQPVEAETFPDDEAQQPEAQIDNTDFDALPEDTQPLDAETFPDDVQNVEAVELPQDDAQPVEAETFPDNEAQQLEAQTDNTDFDALPDNDTTDYDDYDNNESFNDSFSDTRTDTQDTQDFHYIDEVNSIMPNDELDQIPDNLHADPSDMSLDIEDVLERHNSELADKVLLRAASLSTDMFQVFVTDLLSKMGYITFQTARYTPDASGSSLIHGVILDPKAKTPIYIHAEKLSPGLTVGRSDIKDFADELSQLGGSGIFATTGSFSEQAEIYAQDERIMIIDGQKLAGLMLNHNFCVNVQKVFEVKELDEEGFSEYDN